MLELQLTLPRTTKSIQSLQPSSQPIYQPVVSCWVCRLQPVSSYFAGQGGEVDVRMASDMLHHKGHAVWTIYPDSTVYEALQ